MGRELKGPMFDLTECPVPPSGQDGDGHDAAARRIDVASTFSPAPRPPSIGFKLFVLAWMLSVLALSIKEKEYGAFWLAYLTHWALLLSIAYVILSVVSAVYFATHPPANPGVLEGGAGLLVKVTWVSVLRPFCWNIC